MKALKIILIILGVIVLVVGIGVAACATLFVKGAEKMATAATTVENQVVLETAADGGTTLSVPLLENDVYELKGIDICKKEGEDPFADKPYSYTGSCINGDCTATLTFKGAVPDNISINRDFKGQCVTQEIPNIRGYAVKDYNAEFTVPETMKTDKLPEVGKAPGSKYTTSGSFGFNGQYKVSLNYGKTSPGDSDTVMVNGKTVTLKFAPAEQQAPAPQQ